VADTLDTVAIDSSMRKNCCISVITGSASSRSGLFMYCCCVCVCVILSVSLSVCLFISCEQHISKSCECIMVKFLEGCGVSQGRID